MPVIVSVHGRNDFAKEDPHSTTITHKIDKLLTTDPKYLTGAEGGSGPQIVERVDALIIDDENAGVFVLPSDGSTVVAACGNAACTIPGFPDETYKLRLDSQPTAGVSIALITDGQTDIDLSALSPADALRVLLERIGGLQASQAFKGNVKVDGNTGTATITRANGSDTSSFLDEGFQKGMRIRLSGTLTGADGDYVITDLDIGKLTVTQAPPLPGTTLGGATNGTFNGVIIAILQDKGVYQGSIAYDASGVGQTLFTGDLNVSGGGTTVTRLTGSFIDDSFLVGTRIRIGANGPYTIMSVSDKTLTLASGPTDGAYANAVITKATGTLIRTDGSSWLDSGFLEGQLIQLTLPDGTDFGCNDNNTHSTPGKCLYKIEMITGTDATKTDKISLTSTTLVSAYAPDTLIGSGTATLAVLQWAAVAHFLPPSATNLPRTCPDATCGDWYVPINVTVAADPFFEIAPGRQNLRTFGKQPHLLSGIRGPLAVEGGTTSADRSVHAAVVLPGEGNAPPFRVAAQPPEWQQIDTLNIYDDGSKEDLTGNLTSTALTGLNMGPALDFTNLLCSGTPQVCKHPFNEPGIYPGGISYGSITIDPITHNFTNDKNFSTIEVVNIMLGAGNDHLSIQSTLQPGPDFNPITGSRDGEQLAHHGGITAVHGGGNALLEVDGTFEVTGLGGAQAQVTRTDGLAWTRYGFQVGQRITLPDGSSYTVTGFAASSYGAGSTMLLDGGPVRSVATQTVNGEVAVSDFLAVTSTFTLSTGLGLGSGSGPYNGILLTNGQAWQSLGFAVGQQVFVPGQGVRTIVGYANGVGLNADGLPLDGAILLVDGAAFTGATTLLGTVSLASRYRLIGDLTLTGSGDGGTVSLTVSPSVLTASGLNVGQQVWVSGVNNGPRTISSLVYNPLSQLLTLTLTDGLIPSPVSPITSGTIALVRIGGDAITLTGPSFNGTVTTPTTTTIVRTDGSWKTDGFAVGQQVILGGGLSGIYTVADISLDGTTLTVSGGTVGTPAGPVTVTVLPVGAGPGQPYDNYAPLVIYGDTSQDGVWYGGDPHTQSLHNFGPKPMPHIEGATVDLARSGDSYTGYISYSAGCTVQPNGPYTGACDFRSDGFAVGNELALGPPTITASSAPGIEYDILSDRLRRHTGSWVTDGFQIGQQVTIDGLLGTWNVKGFGNSSYGANTELELGGPQLTPYPNQSMAVKAVSQYVGIIKSITKTQIVLNLAISVADFPSGPLFPVASGATLPNQVKDLRTLNRLGNSAPFFVFPLANPFQYSGNDVIDAHLLDVTDPTGALRPIGLTIYGGAGNDTIIGSQTGDQLAGGSGDDTILGQRGQDHIYGDSGFNVDLITRLLTVAVVGNGPAGYPAAQFKNKDLLAAGNDLLFGEGPGSATYATTNTVGNDDDIIFGDLGVVTQDVSGARDVTKPVPATPQKISTTSLGEQRSVLNDKSGNTPPAAQATLVSIGVLNVDSKALSNGGNDWIYGNTDRDLLVGGAGSDAIDGGIENDMLFGDNVSLARTYQDYTSPRFQLLCGSLLYSRSDEPNPCGGNVNADSSGALLTNGVAQPYRDVNDTPWWAEYDVTNLWHDFAATNGTHWAGTFGNDYLAGNQANDLILGGLGDDTIQGDGSIDFNSPGSPTTAFGGIPAVQRVGAFRGPAVCTNAVNTVCDPTGLLVTYPSVERSTDGEDYIEGNAGNDVILGGLGQDDIVGGSSDFFSLADQTIKICDAKGLNCLAGTWKVVGVNGGTFTVTGPTLPNDALGTTRTIALVGNALTIVGTVKLAGTAGGGTITRAQFDWSLAGLSSSGANMRPDGGDYPTDGSPFQSGKGDVGHDLIYGGAGTQISMDNVVGDKNADGSAAAGLGDLTTSADMHARDSDTIVGDNGDIVRIVGFGGAGGGDVAGCADKMCLNKLNPVITDPTAPLPASSVLRYVTYNFDNYDPAVTTSYSPNGKIVVRGVTLLDYTIGGPDFRPDLFGLNTNGVCSTSPATGACGTNIPTCHGGNFNSATGTFNNVGGADEVHAESGDDFVYTGCGNDVIFGDAQNDQLIAGWGADWVSGGTGQDGVLGDDGRIFESRNEAVGVQWVENYSTGHGGWGNPCTGTGTLACQSEPLFGIAALLPASADDPKVSQGNVLSEFISTPGMVQTSTINIADALAMAFDITPFNETPNAIGADQPLFDANNEDDVIFGGWDGDFLHGASGDDAISGAEAAVTSYVQNLTTGSPTGLVETDWYHPWNPADILHFGADTNAWHSNHHTASRLGEFLLYDEYDPRRAIEFNLDGTVWKGTVQTSYQYFLNNNAADGRIVNACIAVDNQGNCTLHSQDPTSTVVVKSDGPDAVFGDLGNDWLLGGTGNDTLWGGWGNDLLNADDDLTTGCAVYLQNGHCDVSGTSALNDVPDGPNSSYEDRAYGGAGLDILIGNTGGDRLIDWVGEFNSYIVPFSTFGIATVSRQNDPWLPEFLYALSHSQGADPTRATDTGDDPSRNGEPDGELGLIRQSDHGLWQEQTGGPTDPQAGNLPGGKRDVLRSADFNDGSLQAFAIDSGSWTVSNGQLQVSAASQGKAATAVYYVDKYLPIFYEISASIEAVKSTAGWNSNAYVLFDYWSPTDFKFAGIDDSTNKLAIGHVDATGWHLDTWGSIPGGVKPDTFYNLTIDVNGTIVTVTASGSSLSYTFATRTLCDPNGKNCVQVGLNKGLVGVGSNNSRGVMDNVSVSSVWTGNTVDATEYFEDGTPDQFTGPSNGAWTESNGRDIGTAASSAYVLSTADYGTTIQPNSSETIDATLSTTGTGGIVFDAYASNDFKFAVLNVPAQRIDVGHLDKRGNWVVDVSFAATLVAGTDYTLEVVLKDTVATVSLNGSVLGSWMFNAAVADGKTGLVSRGGTTSVDQYEFRTDDPFFLTAPPQPTVARLGDASVTEGNSGTTAGVITLTLSAPLTAATTIGYRTIDGTAKAGSDFTGVTTGTVTAAAGATSVVIPLSITGDTVYEFNETFTVQITSAPGLNLADGFGVVTIVNDDLGVSATNASVTEGDNGTTTVNVPITLTRASATAVSVTVTTVAGTASAGGDFVSKSAVVTFAPGVTTMNFQVSISNDRVKESTETFTVVLSNATGGAAIANGTATVTIIDNDGAMLAAEAAPAGTTSAPLTAEALAPVVTQAERMWQSAVPGADFSGYTISIGDLPGGQLGWTDGRATTIDATAAGFGWWTGATSGPTAQMDLLTVVLHELGRVLALTTDDASQFPVMAAALAPGQRLSLSVAPSNGLAGNRPVATAKQIGASQRSGIHSSPSPWTHASPRATIRSHVNHAHARRNS
ncbi:MAG: Calx-beta domain-containing protein [Gaiellaceae bacterium]